MILCSFKGWSSRGSATDRQIVRRRRPSELSMRHIAVLLLLLSGCRYAANVAAPDQSPFGCYALEIGEWSRPWPPDWEPPRAIRLDSLHLESSSDDAPVRFVLHPLATMPSSRGGGRASWRAISADSLQLTWGGDNVAVDVRVEYRADELSGWALASTDVIEPADLLPRAAVQGSRIACSSVPGLTRLPS